MKNIIHAFRQIAKVSKSIFLVMALVVATSAFIEIVDLFLLKYLIDYALSERFWFGGLVLFLGVYFVVLILLKVCLHYISGKYIYHFEVKLKTHTIKDIYKKSMELDAQNYNKETFYDKLNRAFEQSESGYFMVLTQMVTLLINIIVFFCVFTIYNDLYILLAVFINVAVYITYYFIANKKWYQFEKRETKYTRFEEYVGRVFSEKEYAQEFRVYPQMAKRILDNYEVGTEHYLNNVGAYLKKYVKGSLLMVSVSYIIYWLSGVYIASLLLGVKITTGDFLVLIGVVAAMSQNMIRVLQVLPNIYQSSLHIEDIREVMDMPSVFVGSKTHKMPQNFESLSLDKVCFRYDAQSAFKLEEVSFNIHAGEVVAIVGQNGSGKTTLTDCILGLLKPDGGSIKLNGVDYDHYDMNELRKLFGVVFQDYKLYELSIAENILMRKPISEEDMNSVREALRFVGLYEKVMALEKGLDTVISSESMEFSGGERQRLAIARAYAGRGSILIFDEPTGALDVYATNAFYEHMYKLKHTKNQTILFTTHKLEYARRADKVILLENGRAVEKV